MCASLIDESKVEETTVCTSAVDDVINHFFQRTISLLIFYTENWRLNRSYYLLLLYLVQHGKK